MTAAIYARKSTEQAIADEQKSVTRQIAHARDYAARKGWTVAEACIYVDDGVSGAEFANRPGFVRLMSSLKPRAPFQVLVMSEESRLGRESIETAYALKQLVTAGVRVFFYLEDRERTLDSPTDKIMLSLAAFADELEREKARQRTFDALLRKARAGHVTGGRVFGYDNVDIPGPDGTRSHAELQVNPAEAEVVRRIFDLCQGGSGLRTIAKQLNVEAALAPRSQQGRVRAWAPSSVREILHRDLYRGRRVWNKTRKRDAWGQVRQHAKAASEWLTIEAEHLRIVPDALWTSAHQRIGARSDAFERWRQGQRSGTTDGRGVRRKYFLAGFGRCGVCRGSMQAVSRSSTIGRSFRYICSTYWNRGVSVCPNGRTVTMSVADQAVQGLLATEVLQPTRIERALDYAVRQLQCDPREHDRNARLEERLAAVNLELANLAEVAAKGGAVPVVLDALADREEERRQLQLDLAVATASKPAASVHPDLLRSKLRSYLSEWGALLTENVAEARALLNVVLADRIVFLPVEAADSTPARYRITVPIAFDRVISAAIPDLGGLQDLLASPPGFDEVCSVRTGGTIDIPTRAA